MAFYGINRQAFSSFEQKYFKNGTREPLSVKLKTVLSFYNPSYIIFRPIYHGWENLIQQPS